jgi:hypothetical protein
MRDNPRLDQDCQPGILLKVIPIYRSFHRDYTYFAKCIDK